MDELVLRGLARWPNVPAVFGWLSLDRRGNWLIKGEPVANATVTAYIGRNYERDSEGRWFFQNGPQRVYVELEYTPFVYRIIDNSGRIDVDCHTGVPATALYGAWIDEDGALVLETEHGAGVVHDRDLEAALPALVDTDGASVAEDELERAMALLQQGKDAALWMRVGASNVKVEPMRSSDAPERFGFVAHPAQQAGATSEAS